MSFSFNFRKCRLECAACVLVLWLLPASAQESQKPEVHGIAVNNMDRSVKPGDDFYQYANGGWIQAHRNSAGPRPGSASSPRSLT